MVYDIVPVEYCVLSNYAEAKRVSRYHKHSQNSSHPMSVSNCGIGQVSADRKKHAENIAFVPIGLKGNSGSTKKKKMTTEPTLDQ